MRQNDALKLFLHLRTLQAPEYAAAAEEVGAVITKNWRHLAGVLDKTSSLAPDDWFPTQAFAAPNGSSVPSGYMVVGAGNCVRCCAQCSSAVSRLCMNRILIAGVCLLACRRCGVHTRANSDVACALVVRYRTALISSVVSNKNLSPVQLH